MKTARIMAKSLLLCLVASCSGGPSEDGEDSASTQVTDSPPDSQADTGKLETGDTSETQTYAAELSDDGSVRISVGDSTYELFTEFFETSPDWTWQRTLTQESDRLLVHDTLTSLASQDLGLVIEHRITPPQTPLSVHLAGVERSEIKGGSTNPTTLLTLAESQLGTVAGDGPGWVQFWARTNGQSVHTGLSGLHLPPGESHSLTLVLYPLEGGDYWDFLNRARQAFAPSLTLPHWDFGPSASVWDTQGTLEAYLARRDLQVGAALPFLDYDNGWIAQGLTLEEQREGYLEKTQEALSIIRAVDPGLALLTELEGIFTQLTAEQSAELLALLPEEERWSGYPKSMTPGQQALLEAWEMPIVDSMPLNDEGQVSYELYVRDGASLIALLTYPESDTLALDNFRDQVRFSLEDVGADGIFVDGGGPQTTSCKVPVRMV